MEDQDLPKEENSNVDTNMSIENSEEFDTEKSASPVQAAATQKAIQWDASGGFEDSDNMELIEAYVREQIDLENKK